MSLICVSLLKKKVSLKSEPPITSALLQVVLFSPPELFLVLFGGGEWIFLFEFAFVFGGRERWRRLCRGVVSEGCISGRALFIRWRGVDIIIRIGVAFALALYLPRRCF